jgi:hypothetical protein
MIPDPTKEIKAIRHRLGAELGFDLDRIIADIQRCQRESGRTYIRLPKREPRTTIQRDEAAKSGNAVRDRNRDAGD